jgi:hypothetical protein
MGGGSQIGHVVHSAPALAGGVPVSWLPVPILSRTEGAVVASFTVRGIVMIRAPLYFSRTRRYRDQATALRYRAKKVRSVEMRVEFEEVAKRYDLLAETVEGQADQHSAPH